MQSTVHINVSAIDYDATSRALATVLDRMQDMIHGKEEFRITSEAAFGWHFFVVTVNAVAIEKLATLLGEEFQRIKGKGMVLVGLNRGWEIVHRGSN